MLIGALAAFAASKLGLQGHEPVGLDLDSDGEPIEELTVPSPASTLRRYDGSQSSIASVVIPNLLLDDRADGTLAAEMLLPPGLEGAPGCGRPRVNDNVPSDATPKPSFKPQPAPAVAASPMANLSSVADGEASVDEPTNQATLMHVSDDLVGEASRFCDTVTRLLGKTGTDVNGLLAGMDLGAVTAEALVGGGDPAGDTAGAGPDGGGEYGGGEPGKAKLAKELDRLRKQKQELEAQLEILREHEQQFESGDDSATCGSGGSDGGGDHGKSAASINGRPVHGPEPPPMFDWEQLGAPGLPMQISRSLREGTTTPQEAQRALRDPIQSLKATTQKLLNQRAIRAAKRAVRATRSDVGKALSARKAPASKGPSEPAAAAAVEQQRERGAGSAVQSASLTLDRGAGGDPFHGTASESGASDSDVSSHGRLLPDGSLPDAVLDWARSPSATSLCSAEGLAIIAKAAVDAAMEGGQLADKVPKISGAIATAVPDGVGADGQAVNNDSVRQLILWTTMRKIQGLQNQQAQAQVTQARAGSGQVSVAASPDGGPDGAAAALSPTPASPHRPSREAEIDAIAKSFEGIRRMRLDRLDGDGNTGTSLKDALLANQRAPAAKGSGNGIHGLIASPTVELQVPAVDLTGLSPSFPSARAALGATLRPTGLSSPTSPSTHNPDSGLGIEPHSILAKLEQQQLALKQTIRAKEVDATKANAAVASTSAGVGAEERRVLQQQKEYMQAALAEGKAALETERQRLAWNKTLVQALEQQRVEIESSDSTIAAQADIASFNSMVDNPFIAGLDLPMISKLFGRSSAAVAAAMSPVPADADAHPHPHIRTRSKSDAATPHGCGGEMEMESAAPELPAWLMPYDANGLKGVRVNAIFDSAGMDTTQDGNFVVRLWANHSPPEVHDYVLSGVFQGRMTHHRITKGTDGIMVVNETRHPPHRCLASLLCAFSTLPLPSQWPLLLQTGGTEGDSYAAGPTFLDALAQDAKANSLRRLVEEDRKGSGLSDAEYTRMIQDRMMVVFDKLLAAPADEGGDGGLSNSPKSPLPMLTRDGENRLSEIRGQMESLKAQVQRLHQDLSTTSDDPDVQAKLQALTPADMLPALLQHVMPKASDILVATATATAAARPDSIEASPPGSRPSVVALDPSELGAVIRLLPEMPLIAASPPAGVGTRITSQNAARLYPTTRSAAAIGAAAAAVGSASPAEAAASLATRGDGLSQPATPAGSSAAADAVAEPKKVPAGGGGGGGSSDELDRDDPVEIKRRRKERKERERHEQGRGDTVLHVACAAGQFEIVRMLLRESCNMDTQSDSDGYTPLMRCCEVGQVTKLAENADRRFYDCANELVTAGSDLHVVNFAGETALHVAFQFRQNGIAELLIANGGKPCPKKCQKCALNMKIRARAKGKGARSTDAPNKKEEVQTVIDEEFGDIDFMQELNRMKMETGLAGSSKFGDHTHKKGDLDGGISTASAAAAAWTSVSADGPGSGGLDLGGSGDEDAEAKRAAKKKRKKKKNKSKAKGL